MATLKIREYSRLPSVTGVSVDGSSSAPDRPIQISYESGTVVNQTVSFTSSSVQSSAFAATTEYIGAIADVAWSYLVAADPTATTSMIEVPADTLIYMAVAGGHKIAVITAS